GSHASRPRGLDSQRDLRGTRRRAPHSRAHVSYSYRYPHHTEEHPTVSFPPVQRFWIKFFRKQYRWVQNFFAEVGSRGYYIRDTIRGLKELDTVIPETIRQMRVIGVDS